jgi:hypothetical protein
LNWSPSAAVSKIAKDGNWTGYYRNAAGSFTTTSSTIYGSSVLKPGKVMEIDRAQYYELISPSHVRHYRFNTTSTSSFTQVHSLIISDYVFSGQDYVYSKSVTTTSTRTFINLRFSATPSSGVFADFIDGIRFQYRVIRGDYPHDSTSTTVVSGQSNKFWLRTMVLPPSSIASVVESVRLLCALPLPEMESIHPGDLATKAVEQLDANNVNMIAFLKDIRKPWELIPKLKELSKLKTHASNYLGYEYGIMPTVSDLHAIRDAVVKNHSPRRDKNDFRSLSAGTSSSVKTSLGTYTRTMRIKLAVNDSDPAFASVSQRLHNIGMFPSLVNLWDLVPYSFVIDWFLNVGEMLEEVDKRGRVASLDIPYSTSSDKLVIQFDVPQHLKDAGYSGFINLTTYRRNTSRGAPSTPLNFEGSNELPNHWLEAGALIVTRTK